MMRLLRKTPVGISLQYGGSFSNNLSAEDIFAGLDGVFSVRMDLDCNLRKRSKEGSIYRDARELADGKIQFLKTLQLHNGDVIHGIDAAMAELNPLPKELKLILQLAGEHAFDVVAGYRRQHMLETLTFTVVDPRTDG